MIIIIIRDDYPRSVELFTYKR